MVTEPNIDPVNVNDDLNAVYQYLITTDGGNA
jgi:hypothetical protein